MRIKIKPNTLYIEANASCQLRCPTCPTTSQGYPPTIGSGYLKFEDFKALLETNPQLRHVEFENRGELFLNPDLLKLIEEGSKRNIVMTADSGTNLNFVHEGVLEGLVKYRFRSLLCSIDGASPETYKIYRVGGDFERVLTHLREINRHKALYHSEYPELCWQFVVFGHNEHELPLAKEMAAELHMTFTPKISWDAEYSPIRNPQFVLEQTGWPAVTREEFERVTGKNYMRSVCFQLWHSPRINWDGKVLGCCWNSWRDFGGNAFTDGYLAAINTEHIQHARRMLLGQAAPIDGIPCITCELYQAMKASGQYLTLKEIVGHRPIWYRGARFLYHHTPGANQLRSLMQRMISRKE